MKVGHGRAGGDAGKVFWRMCTSFLGRGHVLSKSLETPTLSWRSLGGGESSIRYKDLGDGRAQPASRGIRTLSPFCPPEPYPGQPVTKEAV